MGAAERIEQELNDAKKELNEVKYMLKRLDDLRKGKIDEEYPGEKADLEEEFSELRERRKRWESEVLKWGEKLRVITQTETGK